MKIKNTVGKEYFSGIVFAGDLLVMYCSDIFALFLRFGPEFRQTKDFTYYTQIALFTILARALFLYILGTYRKPEYKGTFIAFTYIIKAIILGFFAIMTLAYFLETYRFSRLAAIYAGLLSIVFLGFWRYAAAHIVRLFMDKDFLKANLLIIGADDDSEQALFTLLHEVAEINNIVGFVRCDDKERGVNLTQFPVVGTLKDIETIANRYPVDKVFIATDNLSDTNLENILSAFRTKKNVVFFASADTQQRVTTLFGAPFDFFIARNRIPTWYPMVNRLIDIALSLILLSITLPLILISAVIIKLTSRGPVFYYDKRVGYKGRIFIMYKLRTMTGKARIEGWTKPGNARITPVGRILRHFRIDELPQLINVIFNDMSTVGPRPETRYYTNILLKKLPHYAERLNAKPGITGWAQVNMGYASTIMESRRKLFYDIYYVRNRSITLDLLILLKTIKTVIMGIGAR
ncbi:MAG: sugar transferase [Candidatus Omnitrophica bacterium]|nr:sugar transferase [Candidatus Omnitrophota bacterium]